MKLNLVRYKQNSIGVDHYDIHDFILAGIQPDMFKAESIRGGVTNKMTMDVMTNWDLHD
ncbi:hypothetical protein HWV00_11095 [Moritella sp. 24]|uniref:hypothetical protein n=1 Tax=Moritella sp. 24 TaxID=2746230 RepID=UPI001BA6D7C9|nr:hypothetical protein [Moritella sp. 24]QUM76733.1 hypothetical protein HWV00_11095 [Moritella sp. 24]